MSSVYQMLAQRMAGQTKPKPKGNTGPFKPRPRAHIPEQRPRAHIPESRY